MSPSPFHREVSPKRVTFPGGHSGSDTKNLSIPLRNSVGISPIFPALSSVYSTRAPGPASRSGTRPGTETSARTPTSCRGATATRRASSAAPWMWRGGRGRTSPTSRCQVAMSRGGSGRTGTTECGVTCSSVLAGLPPNSSRPLQRLCERPRKNAFRFKAAARQPAPQRYAPLPGAATPIEAASGAAR